MPIPKKGKSIINGLKIILSNNFLWQVKNIVIYWHLSGILKVTKWKRNCIRWYNCFCQAVVKRFYGKPYLPIHSYIKVKSDTLMVGSSYKAAPGLHCGTFMKSKTYLNVLKDDCFLGVSFNSSLSSGVFINRDKFGIKASSLHSNIRSVLSQNILKSLIWGNH